MSRIVFEGQEFAVNEKESVLDCLLRHGQKVEYGCKTGLCLACLLRCEEGEVSGRAQEGLKENQKDNGFFKACVCEVKGEMSVVRCGLAKEYEVQLLEKDFLSERILRLRFSVPEGFGYRSGHFINLIREEDRLVRSYSLASVVSERFLELHIKVYEEGKMSRWLSDEVSSGQMVKLAGPLGECFYNFSEDRLLQPLLLVGIGTGMAPLYGILRDALAMGHRGEISVVQGAMSGSGLYYVEEFLEIVKNFHNVKYLSSTVDGSGGEFQGKIDDVVKSQFGSLKNYRVFLCGSPNTVNRLKRYCFLAGANMKEIFADPFTVAAK